MGCQCLFYALKFKMLIYVLIKHSNSQKKKKLNLFTICFRLENRAPMKLICFNYLIVQAIYHLKYNCTTEILPANCLSRRIKYIKCTTI